MVTTITIFWRQKCTKCTNVDSNFLGPMFQALSRGYMVFPSRNPGFFGGQTILRKINWFSEQSLSLNIIDIKRAFPDSKTTDPHFPIGCKEIAHNTCKEFILKISTWKTYPWIIMGLHSGSQNINSDYWKSIQTKIKN